MDDYVRLSTSQASSPGKGLPDKINATKVEEFEYDWYIRVKFELQDNTGLNARKSLQEMEARVHTLWEGLKSTLNTHEIDLFPLRLVDGRDTQNVKSHTCYWIIGLPSVASSELTSSRQFLREWQKKAAGDVISQSLGTKRTVQAKFIPRKTFLEHDFKEDTQKWPVEQTAEGSPKDIPTRSGENFKKVAGSNPQQVRQQFLQHAMGSEAGTVENRTASAKLRPAKEVLKRLNYDSEYNPSDYVIGYIDRKAGILETSVSSWKEFQQEDLIAYFKYVPENAVVWDRARKIDAMFNK